MRTTLLVTTLCRGRRWKVASLFSSLTVHSKVWGFVFSVVRRRAWLRSSPQTSAFFLSLSSPPLLPQVYGLFEGMLEKLELDDDGKCPACDIRRPPTHSVPDPCIFKGDRVP